MADEQPPSKMPRRATASNTTPARANLANESSNPLFEINATTSSRMTGQFASQGQAYAEQAKAIIDRAQHRCDDAWHVYSRFLSGRPTRLEEFRRRLTDLELDLNKEAKELVDARAQIRRKLETTISQLQRIFPDS
eukprot:TRINITY_DN7214_c0_g1_i3.p1 TRINITY_DN7214_c0_g1~~TRINITY_DN7214_c0_g1_i3.p1  ORF type:complete len:156 (+),score=14.20 TRINITY_DN7214_c0_g1_i3:62-469(+)